MSISLIAGGLRLRPFQPDDLDPLDEALQESLNDLIPWLPWAHADYRREETEGFLNRRAAAWDADEEMGFAITDATEGAILGACGLNLFDRPASTACLGYWIRSSRHGQGIATAAARRLAQWGFSDQGLSRIELLIGYGNTASCRVAEKIGARLERSVRGHHRTRELPRDMLLFVLRSTDLAG